MGEAGRIVRFAGTFLPLGGLVVTFVVAAALRGWKRWVALVAGPALTLAASMAAAEQVARDGNMLFVVSLLLLYVFVIAYYPALLTWLLSWLWMRRRRPVPPGGPQAPQGE